MICRALINEVVEEELFPVLICPLDPIHTHTISKVHLRVDSTGFCNLRCFGLKTCGTSHIFNCINNMRWTLDLLAKQTKPLSPMFLCTLTIQWCSSGVRASIFGPCLSETKQIDLRPDPLTNLPSCTHPGQRPFLTLNGANCTDPSDASLSSMISMPIKTLTALVIDQKYN